MTRELTFTKKPLTKRDKRAAMPYDPTKLSIQNGFMLLSHYRSSLMGFAALWIYFFHEWLTIFDRHVKIHWVESFILKRIGFCAVDIFLFLSGIGITYSVSKSRNPLSFYYKRIRRTIVPFVLVALLNCYSYGWTATQFWQNVLTINFYRVNIYSFLWFVPAILTLYFFSPLYCRLFTKSTGKVRFTLCALIIWLVCTLLVRDSLRYDMFGFTNRIPVFIIGILAGWLAQNRNLVFDRLTWRLLTFILLLGLYLSYLTNYLDMYILVPSSNCCVPNILIAISLPFLLARLLFTLNESRLFRLLGKLLVRILSFFGMFTLELYCVQEWLGEQLVPGLSADYSNLTVNIILFCITTTTALGLYYLSRFFWLFLEWVAGKIYSVYNSARQGR